MSPAAYDIPVPSVAVFHPLKVWSVLVKPLFAIVSGNGPEVEAVEPPSDVLPLYVIV